MADLDIENSAQSPAEVEQDGTRIKQHSLRDRIEADRYLASKAAQRRKSTGLNFFRISPPGAV